MLENKLLRQSLVKSKDQRNRRLRKQPWLEEYTLGSHHGTSSDLKWHYQVVNSFRHLVRKKGRHVPLHQRMFWVARWKAGKKI